MKLSNTSKLLLFISGLLLCTSVLAQEIALEDQLLLYLPMDGDALDHSGNHIPTMVRGPRLTEDRFGNPDRAYQFDGIDDSINLNNSLPLITSRSFTICIWAKFLGESFADLGSNTLFEQRDDNASTETAQSTILFNSYFQDKLVIFMRSSVTGEIFRLEGSADTDPQWHHYVARVDENKRMEIYVDAQLIGESVFGNDGDFISSIDHVNLGTHHYTEGLHGALNGIMDDVFIYNRALNMCEIEALYSGQLLEER